MIFTVSQNAIALSCFTFYLMIDLFKNKSLDLFKNNLFLFLYPPAQFPMLFDMEKLNIITILI